MKNKQNEVSQDGWKGEQNNTAQRHYRKHKKHTEGNKAHRYTDIRKAMPKLWREANDGQEHWLMHWGWLKSDQTCTQANMLVVFPLTKARDRRWWSHCCSLGSPEMSTSFFTRQISTDKLACHWLIMRRKEIFYFEYFQTQY